MDMKLEVVPIPVRNVDAAKDFYTQQVGFTLDHDVRPGGNMRVVQMTPPGSACSVVIGEGLPLGEPGSVKGVQLVVEDLDAVRSELAGRLGESGPQRGWAVVAAVRLDAAGGSAAALARLEARAGQGMVPRAMTHRMGCPVAAAMRS